MVLFGIFHSATWRTSPRDLSAFFTKQTQILTHNTIHHILFFSFIISDHIICPHHPHDCPHGGGGGSSGSSSSSSGSGSGSGSDTATSTTGTTGSSTSNSNTGTSNSNTGTSNTNTGSTNTGTVQSTYSSETGFDLYVSNGDGSYTIFEEDNYENNQTPELWYEDDDGEWTRFDLYYQNGEDEYVEYNTGNDGDGNEGDEDSDTPDLWYKNDDGEWTIFRTSEEYYDYSKVSNDCDTETDVDCVRDLKVNAMLADLGIGVIGLGGIAVIGALVARSVSHGLILPMDGIDVFYMIHIIYVFCLI